MGEIAEMMLDGTLCACCGVVLIGEGEEPEGYPQYCADCDPDFQDESPEAAAGPDSGDKGA